MAFIRDSLKFLLKSVRRVLLGILFATVSVVALPLFLVRYKSTNNNRLYGLMLDRIAIRLMGLRLIVRNEKRLVECQPCVYVANHQAALDIIVHSYAYPNRTVVVAKRSLGWIPVFGWLMYLGGNLLIKRQNRKHSLDAMNDADIAIRERGTSIWFFPEGTRSHEKGLAPFKRGAFHCAIKNQIPLVPVVASTFFRALDLGRWKMGTVIVQVGEPIPTAGLGNDDIDNLMSRAHAWMKNTIAALDAELATGVQS